MYKLMLLGLLAAVLAACAEEYVYMPENATTINRSGVPAQSTKIPEEAPTGTIESSSLGIKTVHLSNGSTIRALDVRFAVDNQGDDTPWLVDSRNQLIEIPGVGRASPILVNGIGRTPDVQVGRRQRIVFDLYYPLPPQAQSEGKLPAFDFLWEVQTPRRLVAGRSKFNRIDPYEYYYPYGFVNAWGPYWWYGPWWPYGWWGSPWGYPLMW